MDAQNKASLLILILLAYVMSFAYTSVIPQSPSFTGNSPPTLSPIQQKLLGLFKNSTDSAAILQSLQSSGFMQLINQIPEQLILSFLQQLSSGSLDPTTEGYNVSTNFSNWGETVSIDYTNILYPSQYPPFGGQQILKIQQFVRQGAINGKRVRGAANRHSWTHIFSDPEQLLVSFYPHQIVDGTAQALDYYSQQMTQLEENLATQNIEHLGLIRKVGEINENIHQNGQNKKVTKYLIKIGASVSNNQLRLWSIKNGYQYQANTIIETVSFVGALCTCSHGSGISTRTLPDYVHEIQFIDYNGNRHIISRAKHPHLINSAASSLGLLGLIIFVTIEMQDLQIVKTTPRNIYKDLVIPWPKNYANKDKRLERDEWKQWASSAQSTSADLDWTNNFNKFKDAVSQTYSEWFYFPIEGFRVFENVWSTYAPKTPQNVGNIFESNGIFLDDYPPPQMVTLSEFSQFISSSLSNNIQTQSLVNVLMRNPFAFFPQSNIYLNYPDAIHFQRGVQNSKVRDFQVQINIPALNNNGKSEPDYDLIQKIWWTGLQFSEKNSDVINMALEMRLFKGSNATLAPEKDYEYTCSIEIVRTLTLTPSQQQQWKEAIVQVFNAWNNIVDSNEKPIIIRPHWGKEWDAVSQIKDHVFKDEGLKANFRKFLADYKQIAKQMGFDYLKNMQTFSNELYRNILNNAIGKQGVQIN